MATSALTAPNGSYLLMELQRRATGMRIATFMHRAYIAAVILVGLGAIGQAQEGADKAGGAAITLLIVIGFGVAGLLNRTKLPPGPSLPGDPDMKRLQEAVPLIESRWGWSFAWAKREYESKMFYRACWWMVAGGTVGLLLMMTQL